jgi:hypothetical protein
LPHSISQPSPSDHERPNSSRHIALWLFASFQFFYLLTSTGRVRTPDEYNSLYTTESLVLHGSTAVPQAVRLNNFYGRWDVHGVPRAAYPPGHALAAAPWFALGQYVLARLPGVPTSPPDKDATDLVVAFSACLSSATFAALAVTLFFLLLMGIGIPLNAGLMATAMVGLGTPIFSYSAWFFSEPLSAAIFLGVAWLIFTRKTEVPQDDAQNIGRTYQPISSRTAALAGLILGLSTLIRPTNVLSILVFALALLIRDGSRALRTAVVLCAASAIGVALLSGHNALLFGSPFSFGYPTAAEGGKQLNRFDTPILTGLYGFLFSPGKSIFIFAPPVILALAGLGRLWRRDRALAALAVLFPVIELLFYAKYSQWEGGYCVGPRYLVPGIVFLCLALGPVLADAWQKSRFGLKVVSVALLILGALVQAVSLATSFMEDQVPRGRYYDAHWTYRLNYSLTGPTKLFWKYINDPQPARLGLGWDRWFVFLSKGGVSRATLAILMAAMIAGLAISLLGLSRAVSSES